MTPDKWMPPLVAFWLGYCFYMMYAIAVYPHQ